MSTARASALRLCDLGFVAAAFAWLRVSGEEGVAESGSAQHIPVCHSDGLLSTICSTNPHREAASYFLYRSFSCPGGSTGGESPSRS